MANLTLSLPSLPPVLGEGGYPPRYWQALLEELAGAPGEDTLTLTGRWCPEQEADVYWLPSTGVGWVEVSLGPEELAVLDVLRWIGIKGPIQLDHPIGEYVLSSLEDAVENLEQVVREIATCSSGQEAIERYGILMEQVGFDPNLAGILWGLSRPHRRFPPPPDLAHLVEEAGRLQHIPTASCLPEDDAGVSWTDSYTILPWLIVADRSWASSEMYYEIWDEYIQAEAYTGFTAVHEAWQVGSEAEARELGKALKAALHLKEWLFPRILHDYKPAKPMPGHLAPPKASRSRLRKIKHVSMPGLEWALQGLMEAKGGLVEALFD